MSTVSINLSQSTLNTLYAQALGGSATPLSQYVDVFFLASYGFALSHPTYASSSLVGTTGLVNFSDGAYESFNGVVDQTPGAASGTATVSSVEEYIPSAFSLTFGGNLGIKYATTSSGQSLEGTGGTITSATIKTLIPTTSPDYDSTFGNVSVSAHGSVLNSSSDVFSGVITSIEGQADRFLVASVLTGQFNVKGDGNAIAEGLATTELTGTLNTYTERYTDGSYVSVTGASMTVVGSTVIDEKLLANPANFAGNDVIDITLPQQVTTGWLIASGAGDDLVTIRGGAAGLSVSAGSGNDTVAVRDHGHAIDGGAGLDVLSVSGNRAAYVVAQAGAGYTLRAAADGAIDALINIERIKFDDASVAFDITGNAGQAYRVYQATFDRKPDLAGQGYWLAMMDKGMSLDQVAAGFMASDEFTSAYGSNPTNDTFVTKLYQNVLHRAPEQAGYDYWMNYLAQPGASKSSLLAQFSESGENQAQVIGAIQNGIEFTLYV